MLDIKHFNVKHSIHRICETAALKLCLLITCFTVLTAHAGNLKIGAVSVKITPKEGIPMAGYYRERIIKKIHDDLYVKAMVIENDGKKVAIVSCDLIRISSGIVARVRNIVEKTTGIKADHIMISATHSHTGPVIPKESDRFSITGKMTEIHGKYIAELTDLIAESVKLANEALAPAKISAGLGHEESISFNRRFFMTDGTIGWSPGKMNPKVIKPAGLIDPDVLVLYAETHEGKPVSTYVNFALHLDNVGGTEVSADMPYTLSTILGKIKGSDMVTLYAQGCSGNINHVNVKTKEPQKGHLEAQRIGTVLAGEIIKTYTKLKPIDSCKIFSKSEVVKLPLPMVMSDELPVAQDVISRIGATNAPKFLELVNAYKVIDVLERKGQPIEAEVQVIALGNQCAIVCLPGEIFAELGMYIKSRSPFQYTMVVELANGDIGYVPDYKAYIEGNYESVSSRCGPGSGEILAEISLKLLNELKIK